MPELLALVRKRAYRLVRLTGYCAALAVTGFSISATAGPAPACGDPQVIELLTNYEVEEFNKLVPSPEFTLIADLATMFGSTDRQNLKGKLRVYGVRTLSRDTRAGRNECRARVTVDHDKPSMV